jgi:hypothetical protein
MTSPLDRLKDLKAEPPDAKEFAGLNSTAAMRLRDARRTELALESRFALAYDAAHAYCLAALRYRGYRAANRYIVFQVLPHTLGLGAEVWRVLSKCHDMRNLAETKVSSTSPNAFLQTCSRLVTVCVKRWRRSRRCRE